MFYRLLMYYFRLKILQFFLGYLRKKYPGKTNLLSFLEIFVNQYIHKSKK